MRGGARVRSSTVERGAAPAGTAAGPTQPTRFVDHYLAYLLAQASHRISDEFHREIEATGLSVTEWRVLASLSGGVSETIGALSALTLTKQPTLSKIVQRMERQGLVVRSNTLLDRRQTLVALTGSGQKMAAQHVQRALRHQARVMKPLGARDARLLLAVLRRLVELPR